MLTTELPYIILTFRGDSSHLSLSKDIRAQTLCRQEGGKEKEAVFFFVIQRPLTGLLYKIIEKVKQNTAIMVTHFTVDKPLQSEGEQHMK